VDLSTPLAVATVVSSSSYNSEQSDPVAIVSGHNDSPNSRPVSIEETMDSKAGDDSMNNSSHANLTPSLPYPLRPNISLNSNKSVGNQAVTNILYVFFSAPLAWRDKFNKLHPLDILDYGAERDSLLQVLREVYLDELLP
jgi:hypothetical protein